MPPREADAPPPIILTLWMPDDAKARFQALRDAHFPPALNRVPAHLTLFHHLPGAKADEVERVVREACAARPAFEVEVNEPRSIGRGVTLRCASDELTALRAEIADTFAADLTRQDQQGWRPHVTVQNKVTGGRGGGHAGDDRARLRALDVRGARPACVGLRGRPVAGARRAALRLTPA